MLPPAMRCPLLRRIPDSPLTSSWTPTLPAVVLCQAEAYHAVFTQHVLEGERPICKLGALHMGVAVKLWAPTLAGRHVILHSDRSTVVAIFQAGRGRNCHIQACALEIWLACVIHDVTFMCTPLRPIPSILGHPVNLVADYKWGGDISVIIWAPLTVLSQVPGT